MAKNEGGGGGFSMLKCRLSNNFAATKFVVDIAAVDITLVDKKMV